ncbi:(2,3-dihydroxybenzoyl)adenylate synthase [Nocardiopsis changdeensis]|uniref:AMP-binding protein n=1 Tax=Nocardiopsis changdeensis TaxID=2831969 RepID=A0ABX8BV38_9ACTN|nr:MULTISPECIES: AMP-binding protein [Nocardiopsis]QUX25079.1 AMP-binding protein [Nocardiopsis changdeensis]QYX35465.1 AMP-binding protein [Nocardiopsis sp. MT53]
MTQDWPRPSEEEIRSYREQGFREDRTLSRLLRERAAARPGATALVSRSGRLTYAELDARVDRLALGLAGLPIHPGERVLVRLPNREEYVLTLFALLRIGAVPVLALPSLGPAEVESLARTADACALVVADRHGRSDPRAEAARMAERLPGLRHVLVAGDPGDVPARSLESLLAPRAAPLDEAADPEDLALLLLSGGTTGTPKLIPRTHADYGYNARASAEACGVDSGTVYLAVLPAAHNFTMVSPGIVGVLGAGGTVVLCPDPSPTTAFGLIEREGVTLTSLVPALVPSWLDEARRTRADLSSLRVLQVGGSRLDDATARRIGPELGCHLQQVFGMAEGLNNYTPLDAPDDVVCGTQGRPLSPADEVLVVDEDGATVPDGAPGELLTRGPYTLRGYYRARELDALRFTPDGFYRTGDLVTRTPAGDLVVVGRVKDQVNRAGEKIAAVEVEEHLLAVPGVRAAAVVGLPDPHLGERSVAFLVTEGPVPSREEVRAAMLGRGAAPFKVPDEVRGIGALPLTGVGKVDKKRLRAHGGA